MSALPQSREDWLRERRSGLGGSDAAAVLGISPWTTPLELYLRKRGELPEKDIGERGYWGTVLEEAVADRWASLNGRRIERVKRILRHPDHHWMLGNIDRAVWSDGRRPIARANALRIRIRQGLEVKTAGHFARDEWVDGESDLVPMHYTAQVMHYIAITGAECWHVACLIGGQEYVQRVIERDDELIRDLIDREQEFWADHVIAGVPPDPRNLDDVRMLYRRDNGTALEATPAIVEACLELANIKAHIDGLEQRERELKLAVQQVMGEAAQLISGGQVIATWKKNRDGASTDWQAIVTELADQIPAAVIAKYTTPKHGARPFALKLKAA